MKRMVIEKWESSFELLLCSTFMNKLGKKASLVSPIGKQKEQGVEPRTTAKLWNKKFSPMILNI